MGGALIPTRPPLSIIYNIAHNQHTTNKKKGHFDLAFRQLQTQGCILVYLARLNFVAILNSAKEHSKSGGFVMNVSGRNNHIQCLNEGHESSIIIKKSRLH